MILRGMIVAFFVASALNLFVVVPLFVYDKWFAFEIGDWVLLAMNALFALMMPKFIREARRDWSLA
jgi:hypothetical protein